MGLQALSSFAGALSAGNKDLTVTFKAPGQTDVLFTMDNDNAILLQTKDLVCHCKFILLIYFCLCFSRHLEWKQIIDNREMMFYFNNFKTVGTENDIISSLFLFILD